MPLFVFFFVDCQVSFFYMFITPLRTTFVTVKVAFPRLLEPFYCLGAIVILQGDEPEIEHGVGMACFGGPLEIILGLAGALRYTIATMQIDKSKMSQGIGLFPPDSVLEYHKIPSIEFPGSCFVDTSEFSQIGFRRCIIIFGYLFLR